MVDCSAFSLDTTAAFTAIEDNKSELEYRARVGVSISNIVKAKKQEENEQISMGVGTIALISINQLIGEMSKGKNPKDITALFEQTQRRLFLGEQLGQYKDTNDMMIYANADLVSGMLGGEKNHTEQAYQKLMELVLNTKSRKTIEQHMKYSTKLGAASFDLLTGLSYDLFGINYDFLGVGSENKKQAILNLGKSKAMLNDLNNLDHDVENGIITFPSTHTAKYGNETAIRAEIAIVIKSDAENNLANGKNLLETNKGKQEYAKLAEHIDSKPYELFGLRKI